jgi:hypothetical protein
MIGHPTGRQAGGSSGVRRKLLVPRRDSLVGLQALRLLRQVPSVVRAGLGANMAGTDGCASSSQVRAGPDGGLESGLNTCFA